MNIEFDKLVVCDKDKRDLENRGYLVNTEDECVDFIGVIEQGISAGFTGTKDDICFSIETSRYYNKHFKIKTQADLNTALNFIDKLIDLQTLNKY